MFTIPTMASRSPQRHAPLFAQVEGSDDGPFAGSRGSGPASIEVGSGAGVSRPLQPVFDASGQHAMHVLPERDTVSEDDSVGATDADQLFDFLEEPEGEAAAAAEAAPRQLPPVRPPPSLSRMLPDGGSPGPAAAFGSQARNYLTVLMQVFERARLTQSQQVGGCFVILCGVHACMRHVVVMKKVPFSDDAWWCKGRCPSCVAVCAAPWTWPLCAVACLNCNP
jgi:hypothetical protein